MALKGYTKQKNKTNSPYYLENILETNEHPEDHKEYVMFHGTTKEATELIKKNGFTPSREELGPGVYVSRDIGKAIQYPLGVSNNKRRVLKVKVDVGKVKIIDQQNHPMQETWHTEHGYDTAWVPPGVSMVLSNQQGNCVYDPKRIKVMQVMKVKENNISRHRHLQSGVSPEDSHVYVMYHGTSKQIAVDIQRNGFKPSKDGMLGAGVYLSRDIRKAIKYPIGADDSDRMVLKVKVDVGKVKIIDVQGHDRQYDWHTYGYDTAWVPPGVGMVPSNQQENCVYDPKRIKVMALLKVAILKKLNPSLEVES
ncbi:uncharacterized protein LOC112238787 [Oncorhynchus tshawytscha]|uniref:PARP catalytic domain-containing protein n=1 Tax=Oncorhynchus tshawytscha TaxID=74940 RepID=A0A8C8IW15_ONCTS|nr:uncharacterized protein LOC112238787 [Oncorhynchus tshawytscha]